MSIIEQTNVEVVQFDYTYTSETKAYKKNPEEQIKLLKGKEILQHFMLTSTITGSYSACRCLFSKHLINNIRFREGKINEDIDWKYKVLRNCKRMAESNQVKYFYFQSGNSTSTGGLVQRDFQLREAADLLAELTSTETYGSIAFLGQVKKARTAFSLLSKIAYFGVADSTIDKKETVKELTKEHRGNVLILLKAPLSMSRKVLVVMFALSFPMTKAVIQIAKRL